MTAATCLSMTLYSDQSTYATSYEDPEIRQIVDNEWYRAAFQAGHETPLMIVHTNVELLSEYQCPNPIRSYNIKLRITSKTKGLPVNYNEPFEDVL